jgi:hypothetical protein
MYSLLAQQVRSSTFFVSHFHPKESCIDGDAVVLAGTGKSLLLRAIIMALKKKHPSKPEVVSVTASTGMAASNIGGNALLIVFVGTFF